MVMSNHIIEHNITEKDMALIAGIVQYINAQYNMDTVRYITMGTNQNN